MMLEVSSWALIAGYLVIALLLRSALRFARYPFFWVFFWSTFVFNVAGIPFLEPEWVTDRLLTLYLIVLAGMVVVGVVLVVSRGHLALDWSGAPTTFKERVLPAILLSAGLVVAYVLINGPPLIFSVGAGLDAVELVDLRTDMQFGEGKFHWFRPGFYMVPVVAAAMAYTTHLRQKTFRSTITFVFVFAYAAVASIAFLNKTPMVVLLTAVLVARTIERGRVSITAIAVVSAAAVGVIVGLYLVYDSMFTTYATWYADIADRIFLAYSRVAGVVMRAWPDEQPFFYGRTIVNPGGLLPYEYVPVAKLIYPYIYLGDRGHAPAPAVAEGYVNFGWLGVLGFVVLVLGSLLVLQWLFARTSRSSASLGLLVYVLYEVGSMSMNSIFFTLLDPSTVAFYVVTWLLIRPSEIAPVGPPPNRPPSVDPRWRRGVA